MCEFCNEPGQQHRRDHHLDPSFAGFFSSDAIESCIKIVATNNKRENNVSAGSDGDVVDDDSDGT